MFNLHLIKLGASGCGQGNIASRIVNDFRLRQFSSSELLRTATAKEPSTNTSPTPAANAPVYPLNTNETTTHTGQIYSADDYRRVRFSNVKNKLVNKNFAIDLIKEQPIVVCDQRVVWSSGGGALGHPKVYINVDPPEPQDCGYSGRRFIKRKYYDEAKHGKSISYQQYLDEMLSAEQKESTIG
jgi:NADH dehydrogenase (ubiquinone) Fe-S protein 6